MRIYLDVCCLNRPFDEQTQDRVRLETEAVMLILEHVVQGRLSWVGSEALEFEIAATPNPKRREEVQEIARGISDVVALTGEVVHRAEELMRGGFRHFDALHIACAEDARVDVLLSTDDDLIRKAARPRADVRVPVRNPLTWLQKGRAT